MTEYLPEVIYLVDLNPRLTRVWEEVFRNFEQVEVIHGDFFSQPADAMVSPANSFGIMDGGLDKAIRDRLGMDVQRRVQKMILAEHHGEGRLAFGPLPLSGAAGSQLNPTLTAPCENTSTAFQAR